MRDQIFELVNPRDKKSLRLAIGGVKFERGISYSDNVTIKTLSPIISIKLEGNRQKYLTPVREPDEWRASIIYGIRNKFKTMYGREPEKLDLDLNQGDFRLKYVHIKGRGYMASEGTLRIKADPLTLQFISDTGLGEKPRYGFGFMIDQYV